MEIRRAVYQAAAAAGFKQVQLYNLGDCYTLTGELVAWNEINISSGATLEELLKNIK